jgi:hypothetical protein
MKYTGDIKENLIVITFSILILIWLYKSTKNIKNIKNTPKWVLIFDKYKLYLYLIILCFYIFNCFDIINNININMKIPTMNNMNKYKMKVYTEPPNFN